MSAIMSLRCAERATDARTSYAGSDPVTVAMLAAMATAAHEHYMDDASWVDMHVTERDGFPYAVASKVSAAQVAHYRAAQAYAAEAEALSMGERLPLSHRSATAWHLEALALEEIAL